MSPKAAVTAVLTKAVRPVIDAPNDPPLPVYFDRVDLSTLGKAQPREQEWFLDMLIPAGQLTLLSAHGGVGKTTLALMIAACIAARCGVIGRNVKGGRSLFFSGEDPASVILPRLARICRVLNLDLDRVRANLHVLDAADLDPALFYERRSPERSNGTTTPAYEALERYIAEHEIDFVVIDGASDAFDADEIKRALVRAFIRSLIRLVRPRNGAVLLLAHIDKAAARYSRLNQMGTDSYSGSTAWHNSARSRLFLHEPERGAYLLEHQKSNLGPRQEPIALEWPQDGVLQLASEQPAPSGLMQVMTDIADTKALVALIHEYAGRGESISTEKQSRSNACAMLSGETTFPRRPSSEVFRLLREAERAGQIQREKYRNSHRKELERWAATDTGLRLIDFAPGAPGAPGVLNSDDSADSATAAPGAPGARGGYGGRARALSDSAQSAQEESAA